MSKDNMFISGIWIVKRFDNEWRGTIVNEFGLKMCDFICTTKKCKLINVTAVIDKWHIKRTIASDIQFILEIDNPAYKAGQKADRHLINDTLTISYKKKILQRFVSGEMVMLNKKHNLTYTFKKIEE